MAQYIVTIITITLNRAHTLERAIKSVLTQDYPHIEYIIIDGGSRDDSVDIIRKYETKIARWVSEPDKGPIDAVNKALKMASGDYIALLPSDDYFEAGAVRSMVDAALEHPEADVLHADIRYFDPSTGGVLICKPFKKSDAQIYRHIYRWPAIYVNTFFAKREIYANAGNNDISCVHAGDFELYLKLLKNNARFFYVDKVIVNHQAGGRSCDSFKGYFEIKDISIKYGCPRIKAYYYLVRKLVERCAVKVCRKCGLGKYAFWFVGMFYPNITVEKTEPRMKGPDDTG